MMVAKIACLALEPADTGDERTPKFRATPLIIASGLDTLIDAAGWTFDSETLYLTTTFVAQTYQS